jgi:hypothetical protein
MPELRRAPRVSAKQQCFVRITGKPDINCTIRNLSNSGAMLNFAHPTILPRAFALHFEGTEQRASVMWQSGRLAGVRFQTPLKGVIAPQKKKWPWSRR